MDRKIEETIALGGTQILMQGGHHPKLTQAVVSRFARRTSKSKFPQVNIHGFSPSEFIHFREVFNEPLEKIIRRFQGRRPGLDSRRRRGNFGGPRAPAYFAAQSDER